MANKFNIVFLLCTFLLPAGWLYAAKMDPAEAEIQRLTLDIPSLYLINGMFFSAEQNKQLAELLQQSARTHEQNQLAIQNFVNHHQKEMDFVINQLISGKKEGQKGPAATRGKSAGNLQKVRAEWHGLINESQHNLDDLAQKTYLMLTPAQRDILQRFVPCFIPPGDFRNPERVGQADGDTSLGETMLTRLKRVPEAKLAEATDRALDGLVPYIMKEKHVELTRSQIDELRAGLRQPLLELIQRVRGMTDSDFELEKKNLAKEFLCLQTVNSARESKSDDIVKIKRYLLNSGIASIIARRAGKTAGTSADFSPAGLAEETKEKNKMFQAAMLINNLQLTSGQALQILPCVQKAVQAEAEVELEAYLIFPPAIKAYTALKKELENQQPAPKTEQEAGKYHHQLKMLYQEKLAKQKLECQAEIDRLLSADQVDFLAAGEGRAKIVRLRADQPQKNISALRIRAREVFDKMDGMSDTEFINQSHNLCVALVDACLISGLIDENDINKEAEINRAEEVLARARHMRRTEYTKAREDLIAEICPRRDKPRPDVYSWQKSQGDQLEVISANTQLLLSQACLKLLEKKIKIGN